jgi:hypothetical protein
MFTAAVLVTLAEGRQINLLSRSANMSGTERQAIVGHRPSALEPHGGNDR